MYRVLWTTREDRDLADVWAGLFDDVKGLQGRAELVSTDDAVLFTGGTDVSPRFYGEEPHPFTEPSDVARDEHERVFFRRAQAAGAACIGVCRGAQFLCALSGGKLIQHVKGHLGTHNLVTDDGEVLLHPAANHHQMMYPYQIYHKLIAWADNVGESLCEYGKEVPDGKDPEIIWIPDTRSLCIQPHPEWMDAKSDFQDYCRALVEQYILGE